MKKKAKALWLLAKIIGKNDPLYLLLIILKALFPTMAGLINIFVPMIFINQITNPRPASDFIRLVIMLIACKFILDLLTKLIFREEFVRRQAANEYITFELGKKAMEISYVNIEDPHVLDLKARANAAINMGSIYQLLTTLRELIQGVFTIFATALIIISFSPYLVVLSIGISVLIILVNAKESSFTQKFDMEIVGVNRRFSYYFSLMGGPKFQKDIRVFDLGDLIKGKTRDYLDIMNKKFDHRFSYEANMGAIKIFLESVLRLISYSYTAARTLSASFGPQIGFGEFSAIIGANESFMTSFQSIFSESASFIMSLENLIPLYEFISLEADDEKGKDKAGDFESLEFKNLTFSYPGSDRIILDDISFKINKGEKISIVGVNNAGKTTIVKLILRFFKPTRGEILYNGRNINEFTKASLYEKISGVLQDFSIMPFTIKDNIIANKDYKEDRTKNILKELDLDGRIKDLDKGLETYLNKDIYEEATDFSLGQKQKLAIARAIYRDSDFLILDEPTASLDPLAEAGVYEHFNEMTEGKTAIFISHRMSSSKFTDKILVLDGGRVSAFDSHKKLMAYDNIYSRLYKAQAKYFN